MGGEESPNEEFVQAVQRAGLHIDHAFVAESGDRLAGLGVQRVSACRGRSEEDRRRGVFIARPVFQARVAGAPSVTL